MTRAAQIPGLPLPTTPSSSTTTSTTVAPTTTAPPSTLPPTTPPDTAPLSVPDPVVPVPTTTTATTTTTTTTTEAPSAPSVRKGSVADALPGAYALGVGAVLLVAAVLVGAAARTRQGGPPMLDPRRRWRLLTGAGCLGLAALVGLLGWLKLSLEPAVNRQIPYLASAGMALVILAAIGGALLVADQLRNDSERIDELEEAVRRLSATLEPIIESTPRTRRKPSA